MILYRLTSLRFRLLAGIIAILLHAFSFLFALSMALTIGAFGAVMMIASIDLMILIPMADLYMVRE
jgi:ABC-type sulfate transport system permease component